LKPMARGFVEPTIQPSYCRSQDIWCEPPDRATLRDGHPEALEADVTTELLTLILAQRYRAGPDFHVSTHLSVAS
jgi:hypothetical protein